MISVLTGEVAAERLTVETKGASPDSSPELADTTRNIARSRSSAVETSKDVPEYIIESLSARTPKSIVPASAAELAPSVTMTTAPSAAITERFMCQSPAAAHNNTLKAAGNALRRIMNK